MLLDAIAMYVLLSSYKGRNKGIIIIIIIMDGARTEYEYLGKGHEF